MPAEPDHPGPRPRSRHPLLHLNPSPGAHRVALRAGIGVAVPLLTCLALDLVVGRNYALALIFITPMALLMGQLAAPRPITDLLLDRGAETAIGGAVALAMIAAERAVQRRRAG